MIYKLEDINNCHVCGGNNLVPRFKVPILDLYGDEELRTVIQCTDCDTLHYIDNGRIEYEFSVTLNESIYKTVKR
jgi:hypothetical protein